MSSIADYLDKCTSPSSRDPMGRLDYALFATLNLAGWVLLAQWLGAEGPRRQAAADTLIETFWPVALVLEWTFLCATLNRAAEARLLPKEILPFYLPGRLLALVHVVVFAQGFQLALIACVAAAPIVFLLICPAPSWSLDPQRPASPAPPERRSKRRDDDDDSGSGWSGSYGGDGSSCSREPSSCDIGSSCSDGGSSGD